MTERKREARVLLVALLATLLLRLLALGADVEARAHPARLNQTIPTMTPTGRPPPTQPSGPTSPPVTAAPSATSGGPMVTWTPTPLPGTVTESPTGSPSGSPPPSATLSPPPASPTLAPAGTEAMEEAATPLAGFTPSPGEAPAALTGTLAVPTTAASPAIAGTPTGAGRATDPASAPAAEASDSIPWDASCLWLSGGLALMAAGLALLLRQRSARGGSGSSGGQSQGDGND